MEFLEGEDLSNGIKRIASAHDDTDVSVELAAITTVGETYARIHALNVALGDTKPENVMVGRDGKIYLLDFEQASHGGDKAWDIAEFLYFSGHYMPLNGERKAEAIACSFINGYLTAGGSLSVIHHAGVSKYTRVFSIFALPSVLRVMSTRCRKAEARKRD